jgi:hypothetical protein
MVVPEEIMKTNKMKTNKMKLEPTVIRKLSKGKKKDIKFDFDSEVSRIKGKLASLAEEMGVDVTGGVCDEGKRSEIMPPTASSLSLSKLVEELNALGVGWNLNLTGGNR